MVLKAYEKVSEQIYTIFYSSAPLVQPVSIDEAYMELLSGSDGVAFAKYVCKKIYEVTGCSASAGVGTNMLLARLATKKAKPNGIYCMPTEHILYMRDLCVRELPGIGIIIIIIIIIIITTIIIIIINIITIITMIN